ncbi:structural maintenance of chromosomes flexible hinge domain-containing protein 1 [Halichoeres trimaculatus]|uniref:structural maintenance of chromosomes flexible hinge domain-containing protein 1 n=1 Tax=Halichoeres trimaculatus TaxID=147232 RepID=UPI003D9ED375
MSNPNDQGVLSASIRTSGIVRRRIRVHDRRHENEEPGEKLLDTADLDFNGFLAELHQEFSIPSKEEFVLTTTDRIVLDFDKFKELQDLSAVYMLQREDQLLQAATEEHVNFTPHYNTLTESGRDEYYYCEGKVPLTCALAELIDNSISATKENKDDRSIEIRMLFDESRGGNAIVVLDNGCGMSCTKLKNWATYRLNKFDRKDSRFEEGYVRPDHVPRSLNSDVSYFGVGGKHAAFFIGESTRMITKSKDSPDVHELILSKKGFEERERNKEEVFQEIMKNRQPGEFSHVDQPFLRDLICEEKDMAKESFTAVVITEIRPEHVPFLKDEFEKVARQLTHIYHYYIHGVNGNTGSSASNSHGFCKVDIQLTLNEKAPKLPRAINLKEIDDDMQTLYIKSSADTFRFQATIPHERSPVEGILRYHPFLYDRETYPQDPDVGQVSQNDDDGVGDDESGATQVARGKRGIFDCYWNGRLIPKNGDFRFDWCTWHKGSKVPDECCNRFSGVLFMSSKFKVNTSKLSFVDLEQILKGPGVIFTRVVNEQSQRSNIQREFTNWLQKCHEKHDKQIKFMGFIDTIERLDVPTKRHQYPWETFSSIEWDQKVYKTGQLVKSQRTQPIVYGTIVKFLRYGETVKRNGSVFATGGEVELALEPKAIHNMNKIMPISKIDKSATDEAIKSHIASEVTKLPDSLTVQWPKGELSSEEAVPAGTPIGPLTVKILNKRGEPVARMPPGAGVQGKKLVVKLEIVHHASAGDEEVFTITAQHTKQGFCFTEIRNLTKLGNYTLSLNTLIQENNTPKFGDMELPRLELSFRMKEGAAQKFTIGTGSVSPTVHVGVPFDIPLQIRDAYDHPTAPPPDLKPELQCSDLDLSYDKVVTGVSTFIISGVKAKGKVQNYQQLKSYDLKVRLPGLKKDMQNIKISLLPGYPHFLYIRPEDDPVTVENGYPVKFDVEVHDEAGNITAHPRQIVHCKVAGLPVAVVNCSNTGAGQIVTKPLNLKITNGEPKMLKAEFEMPAKKNFVKIVRDVKVFPSRRVSRMELTQKDMTLVLRDNDEIEWPAGGLLENLLYKLYDEADREVPLSEELAKRIKVNWTGDVNLGDLVQGKLPDLQVPQKAQKKCFNQVSYQDHNVSVSVSFKITPHPDEPTSLRATLPETTVKLGETLPEHIRLELVDQYNNSTATLTPTCVKDMTAEAEGLDKSSIKFIWEGSTSSVLLSGVQFQTGTPGPRELCITYKSFKEQVILKVTAGDPAELKLISGPEMPLQVFSDYGITEPFIVQLFDKWGNPSADQRVVVQLKPSPPTLKVLTPFISQPVNNEGKASFTVESVIGAKGYYQLIFEGSFNKKLIPSPSVNLTIIPDPKKPVKLVVHFDRSAKFPAGGKFTVFSLSVMSEEENLITTFSPAAVSMQLWSEVPPEEMPQLTVTELKCSKPLGSDKTDCFYFRDKEIPQLVGKYIIQFSLRISQGKVLKSDQISVNVEPNQPVKLRPVSQPPNPVVSYGENISDRTLVEDMTLVIMDEYGNPAGQDLNGEVLISIENSREENRNLPLFEGKTSSCQIDLVKGKAHIERLTIMTNSPGDNGRSYVLLFKPDVFSVSLQPFELPFQFFNDGDEQRRIVELTKKKAELSEAVAKYKDVLDMHALLHTAQSEKVKDAERKESAKRNELIGRNLVVQRDCNMLNINRLLKEKKTRAEQIEKANRRVCTLSDPFRGQQDVLGKVGHLALVSDDAAARVISWQISGDMDCVVTGTKTAAQKIYNDTRGRQQVLPLTNVLVRLERRPLPHIKYGRPLFDPPGHPVYARDLLEYTHPDRASCEKVFINFLGDTILIDDLDSGNTYREQLVAKNIMCPTILTRQGERISSRGKFGGTQNKAPLNISLVFGAPLPQQYHTLKEEIALLDQYKLLLQKKEEARREHDEQLNEMNSPEMQRNRQEMEDRQKELQEIERQLVSSPVRPVRRSLEPAGETSGVIAKRARLN